MPNLKIQACKMLKIQDLARAILNVPELACQILKVQDLEIQDLARINGLPNFLNIQDLDVRELAYQTLKGQVLACQILKFKI